MKRTSRCTCEPLSQARRHLPCDENMSHVFSCSSPAASSSRNFAGDGVKATPLRDKKKKMKKEKAGHVRT